jgi:hypothetical protein
MLGLTLLEPSRSVGAKLAPSHIKKAALWCQPYDVVSYNASGVYLNLSHCLVCFVRK